MYIVKKNNKFQTIVGEFLYVICKQSVDRLIKYVGMGNAMGYLHHRGLLNISNEKNKIESSNDSDNSEMEEYEKIEHLIDPITGIQVDQNIEKLKYDEKEEEKIINDIKKLEELNIISPATIKDGKIVKSNLKNDK